MHTEASPQETDLKKMVNPSRYFTICNEGHEIYTERIGVEGRMASWAGKIAERLKQVQQAMPKGRWSATIEQQFKAKPFGARSAVRSSRYEIRNVYDDGTVGELEVTEHGS